MGLPEPEQTRMYEDYWSEIETLFRDTGSSPDSFLRDYVAFQRKSSTQLRLDQTYAEFKEFWQDQTTKSISDRLEDMLRSARRYSRFLQPKKIESKPISVAMEDVRRLGSVQAILVMRLYECYEQNTLSQQEFVKALRLIESYLVRRSVLRWQIRNYWAVFARMAQSIEDRHPLTSFQVALARQNNRFPTNEEFSLALRERDIYSLRICGIILSQLENAGHAEPSPTSEYSIEHIMPRQVADVPEWTNMLGENWEDVHRDRLHTLGNLTLTAYNSTYSNRPFREKKTMPGGFEESAVRLNRYVKEQSKWTCVEMEERGNILAERALEIWPHHEADEKLVAEDKLKELRTKSAERNPDDLEMRSDVRSLLNEIRDLTREFGEVTEVVEGKSVNYYDSSASFFAESLPMTRFVRVLIPIDFDEVYDPSGLASDVTSRKFLPNVIHKDCGVFIDVRESQQVPAAIAVVRQARQLASK